MNDKKKNPLEGIFAQVTDDDLLRENGLLHAENKQLQSNWNSLFEYAKQQLEKAFDKVEQDTWEEVLEYMNELEGKKKQ